MPTDPTAASNASGVHELVCALIDDAESGGGRPRLGTERVGTRPIAVEPTRQQVVPLAERLASSTREFPYVVIAHDYLDGPGPTMARARTTARRLAGLARVYVLPAQTINPFQVVMGADLDVQPGEARLYLPGEHEPHRHRTLAAEVVRSDMDGDRAAGSAGCCSRRLSPRSRPICTAALGSCSGNAVNRSNRRPTPMRRSASTRSRPRSRRSGTPLYQTRSERSATRAERDEIAQQNLDMQEELELAQLRAEELQEALIDKEHKMVEVLVRAGEAGVAVEHRRFGEEVPAGDVGASGAGAGAGQSPEGRNSA